ncbi:MAG TPA: molecular chaperone [Mucilaginibacter sp.]|jgi:hypothetical protein|nr:molecular chaperone [Mucilaginibacter sp.]
MKKNVIFRSFGLKKVIGLVYILSGLFIYCVVSAPRALAQGNLVIMPIRVVFDGGGGGKRTQELNLANTGNDTIKYLISVVQYRMMDDGTFESITLPDPGQNFADKNFRFFPQSVVLAPLDAQTIKIQLINISDLKPGEYRSHLYIRAVPDEKPLGETAAVTVKNGITIKLIPVYGISIPVIIRKGESTSNVTLSNSSLGIDPSEGSKLKMTFNRSGNMSVYGDITVDYISEQGIKTRVGIANGFAIYTPNKTRHFILNLDENQKVNYHQGKLHVVYAAQPVVMSCCDIKTIKFAEGDLILH